MGNHKNLMIGGLTLILASALVTQSVYGDTQPLDETAPVVSNVSLADVMPTSVVVNWVTNESATQIIKYGKTSAYGTQTETSATLSTSHSISLTGLLPKTTYHYQIVSADAAGNQSITSDATFTTLAKNDPISYSTCLVTAIQKRDGSIRTAWDTFATTVSNAFQTRTEALSTAYFLTTRKERTDAVKAAWRNFRTSRKTARKAFNNVRFNSWKTFREERKVCKAPADAYGSGIDIEPTHSD